MDFHPLLRKGWGTLTQKRNPPTKVGGSLSSIPSSALGAGVRRQPPELEEDELELLDPEELEEEEPDEDDDLGWMTAPTPFAKASPI